MLIKSNQRNEDDQSREPNFRLQVESGETSETYGFIIPTISRSQVIKMQVDAKKSAMTIANLKLEAAMSLEMTTLVFPNIVALDGKDIYEVFEDFNVDEDTRTAVIDKIFEIAMGRESDEQ